MRFEVRVSRFEVWFFFRLKKNCFALYFLTMVHDLLLDSVPS